MRKSFKKFAGPFLIGIAFLFCGCNAVPKEGRAPQPMALGLQAGVNFSDVGGDDAESFDGKTDFHLGVVGHFGICESWSLAPAIVYSRQGSDYSDSEFSGSYDLDYLNIPVIAQYEVADNLTLEAGPQLGFLLSAKDKYSFSGESFEDDVKDFTKGIDFGVNLGAGYMITDNIKLRASYNLGLSNLADGIEGSNGSDVKWRNNVIQVSLAGFLKLSPIKGESQD